MNTTKKLVPVVAVMYPAPVVVKIVMIFQYNIHPSQSQCDSSLARIKKGDRYFSSNSISTVPSYLVSRAPITYYSTVHPTARKLADLGSMVTNLSQTIYSNCATYAVPRMIPRATWFVHGETLSEQVIPAGFADDVCCENRGRSVITNYCYSIGTPSQTVSS